MATGTTFVHDFAGVDQPAANVLAAVHDVLSADAVRELVLRAWETEASALHRADVVGGGDATGRDGLGNGVGSAGSLASGSAENGSLVGVVADAGRTLHVDSGPPRVRRDAMVVPMSWSGAEDVGLPPLEADLEFTSFGDDRTHVHLYGRSAISAVAQPGSRRASLTSRVAVALVRRFLGELADELERAATTAASGVDAPPVPS